MTIQLMPRWMEEIRGKVNAAKHHNQPFEVTLSTPVAKKFVVLRLVEQGVPYKIHNAGVGVSIITTKTDECPCCKQKLKG